MRPTHHRRVALVVATAASLLLPSTARMAVAQPWEQRPKLLASNGGASDSFGQSVDVENGRAVVGSTTADGASANTGAAYIFEREPTGEWVETAQLFADDGQAFDWFGYSVAISGDAVAIGAPFADGSQGESGAAYVFRRDSSGEWVQEAKLVAPDGVQDDGFGTSVAIDTQYEDLVFVGAPQATGNDYQSGVVYHYNYDSQTARWAFRQRLTASDGEAYDLFGTSIGFGGWLVIGAPQDGDLGYAAGAAYVFGRQGSSTFHELDKLHAVGGGEADFFGQSVAASGDSVVVGAPSDDDRGSNAGAAIVFARHPFSNDWEQQAKLLADDGDGNDQFGISVAIDGDRAAVGAYWEGTFGSNEGAAYIFDRDGNGDWAQAQKLVMADRSVGDWFGNSVGLSGAVAIVGVPNDDDLGDRSGSACVFERLSTGPRILLEGYCPGSMTLTASDATPLGTVALIAGFNVGSFTIPDGPCRGLVVELRPPLAVDVQLRRADGAGRVVVRCRLRQNACGVSVQAIDVMTCTAGDRVELR